MKAKRNVIGTALFGVVIAFLFLAPVISYSIPFPSPIGCTMNGCDFLRYGSVSYWAFGVGATVRDLGGYSLSLATATEATRGTSSVSYTVSGLSSAVSPSATSNSSSSGLGLVTSAQIVSVSLLSTSIGSPVAFNITFKNTGGSPIYYARYDGRASPVSANVAPSCPTGSGHCPASPIAAYSTQTDCLATISFVELSPGKAANAYTTYCKGVPLNYQIVAPGVIRGIITLSWSSGPFSANGPGTTYQTSFAGNFTVG